MGDGTPWRGIALCDGLELWKNLNWVEGVGIYKKNRMGEKKRYRDELGKSIH